MGLRASIYTNPLYVGCSNKGISERYTEVCVVNAEGPFEPKHDTPAVELVAMKLGNSVHVYARPVAFAKRHTMFGGAFISTSDSRFGEAVKNLGGVAGVAIGLHDRVE